jgi:large subunit ribosomal protein L10e
VPASKIHQFEGGNIPGKNDFPVVYHLISCRNVQMRSNCLEAARLAASKWLEKHLGTTGFFIKILPYPHHILRENAMATGAGADRFSEGMRQSFGKPIGQAARIKEWQNVILVRTPVGKDDIAKEALRRASTKLPGACRVVAG